MKWIELRQWVLVLTLMQWAGASMAGPDNNNDWASMRAHMVSTISAHARETGAQSGLSKFSEEVLAAMNKVPRHAFVPESVRLYAYEDRPLPIGEGQTISQPFIVALMTELLRIDATSRVLEIGTGSGYQAAVLSEMTSQVFSIEIVQELGEQAARTLKQLHYDNVQVRIGDGFEGWPIHAPFDAIIVTAAGIDIPPPLLDQLKPGGRLVLPLGPRDGYQVLKVIEKTGDGEINEIDIMGVRFVPLTRTHQ
jgi:protein-L-isoaspartate(D-aspartate) O-methyltransferase